MFIIKYHSKGHKSEYFAGEKRVKTKKYALAFGENLREKFKSWESDTCSLIELKVSDMAEMMYRDKYVKVSDISW